MTSIGHPLIGDKFYGMPGLEQLPAPARERIARLDAAIGRQALHASELGFRHPLTGEYTFGQRSIRIRKIRMTELVMIFD